jgi:hypothetical protein
MEPASVFLASGSVPTTPAQPVLPISHLDAALAYASWGWPVLPCKPGTKEPLGRVVHHGAHDARCDREWVEWVWTTYPDANVGIATGIVVDVVDVDDDSFAGLYLAMLPTAPVVRTSRGYHLYIHATGSTSVSKLLPGADLKGLGGYVVAPPSIHETGVTYMWLRDPATAELGPVPKSIHKALDRRKMAQLTEGRAGVVGRAGGASSDAFQYEDSLWKRRRSGAAHDYGTVALEGECAKVCAAAVTTRNEVLNRAAFRLGQLVPSGELERTVVLGGLLGAALSCGLDGAEAVRTINSGMTAGAQQPRQRGR